MGNRTTKRTQNQTAMDEREVENPKVRRELEAALENRENAKDAKSEANAAFKTKDEVVKDRLEELGIEEGEAVRIGRFRVERTSVAAKDVAFTTDPSSRLSIKVAGSDED